MPAVSLDASLSADSVWAPPVLSRACGLGSLVAADSAWGATLMLRGRGMGSNVAADSAQGPAFMLSTDGMIAYLIADSVMSNPLLLRAKAMASAPSAGSTFTVTAGQPWMYRLPAPNRPQPLLRVGPAPLRIVPNPSGPSSASIQTPLASTRRRGE